VIGRRDSIRRLVAASSMVVYGEGSYRCEEHGIVHPALRTPEQLRARDWEARRPACGAHTTPVATREDAPLRPTSVYGITKRDQEELVLVLGRAYGIETVALRYLNVYGPRQALSNPYTGVLAIFASRLLNDRRPLVYEDGGQRRDFVNVADVARACRLALEQDGADGRAVNIGSGRSASVLEIAGQLARVLGKDIEPELAGKFRAGDIRHCFADVTHAREALDFEAAVELDEGLDELASWLEGQAATDCFDEAAAELSERGLTA
jgi:dTDP-L-rhamnose 4-epimerase